jgi:hypothetical protein
MPAVRFLASIRGLRAVATGASARKAKGFKVNRSFTNLCQFHSWIPHDAVFQTAAFLQQVMTAMRVTPCNCWNGRALSVI